MSNNSNKNKNNKRVRYNDNQSSSNTTWNAHKKACKNKGNKDASTTAGNSGGGRDGDRGHCSIQGLDGISHNWRGCHMNPYLQRYDAKAGQEFYNNEAHGPNVWYRDIFQKASGQSYTFSLLDKVEVVMIHDGNECQGHDFGRGRGRDGYQGCGGYQGRVQRGYNGLVNTRVIHREDTIENKKYSK